MNRLKSLICLLAFILVSVAVCAQGFKTGFKGGYNMSSMSLDNDVVKPSGKDGFFVGPSFKLSLPFGLGFDLAGLYDECIVSVSDEDLKIRSIKVPVNLRANIGLGSVAGLYLAAGPEFSFALSKTHDLDNGKEYKSFVQKESYYSINLGAGFYLTSHFEIGAVYSIGVGDNGKLESVKGDNYSNNSCMNIWRFSAAVYF